MKVDEDRHDARLYAPAVSRNKDVIREVLLRFLPASGHILEISSGTGEHAVHFSDARPDLVYQPSDQDERYLASIEDWVRSANRDTLKAPVRLNVLDEPWPAQDVDVVININMIHIAPWTCCEALMQGAASVLKPGGVLFMYGPYKIDDAHTAPSNASFDESLRAEDPAWGIRDLGAVKEAASRHGLGLVESVAMPANNFSVVYRKAKGA